MAIVCVSWFIGGIDIFVISCFFFFFQAEDGIRDDLVTGVQTCALPIYNIIGLRTYQMSYCQKHHSTYIRVT